MAAYKLHHPGYQSQSRIIKAEGAYFLTENGKYLFDAGLGAGSQILGHCPTAITAAIQQQAAEGTLFLHNNCLIHQLCAELEQVLPSHLNQFVFCNSGTEATQRALRYARAATGKNKVAFFQGGWHGMNEWTLLDDGGRFGVSTQELPSGIPTQILEHSMMLPYNDEYAFEKIEQHKNELAAVIIEPVQGSNPQESILPFLKKLQDLCKKNGILLIFDEIITGFRLSVGGAASQWQLQPDLVTYGKILGGGLPIGLVAFTEQVADNTFSDNSKRMLSGGTFSANPLTAATALAVLKQLRQSDYNFINSLGLQLKQKTNPQLNLLGIPCVVSGTDSFLRLYFTDQQVNSRRHRDLIELNNNFQQQFRSEMFALNVLWPTNGIIFTGFCHTAEMIDSLSSNIINALQTCWKNVDART